jgi:16S rRNA (cytosine1402-N4)-methyltransferase
MSPLIQSRFLIPRLLRTGWERLKDDLRHGRALFTEQVPCHPAFAGQAGLSDPGGDSLSQMGVWPWFGNAGTSSFGEERSSLGGGSAGRGNPYPPDLGAAPTESVPFYHHPVLLREIMDLLQPGEGKVFLDVTLGGGGHSEGFLMRGARVVAMDQDPVAIAHATSRLRGFAQSFCALRGNFRSFPELLTEIGVGKFDGILADLGISSRQLDDPAKGFSFQQDGPLDLRMNPDGPPPASELVNHAGQEDLERILIEFGEEPQARRIARAIVQRRAVKPILTTLQLAEVVASVCHRKGHRHPATLTFQALRIAVNDELGALVDLLEAAPHWLKPGGRLAIMSFHSLEDRLVKRAFQRLSAKEVDRPEWPAPRPNPDYCLTALTRKPVEPGPEEVAANPRSRSARLRVAERIPEQEGVR